MSSPKTSSQGTKTTPRAVPPRRSPRKKPARTRLIHIEVRRGNELCLRVAIANGVMADAGEELGALIKRISPGAEPAVATATETVTDLSAVPGFLVTREHLEHDAVYHAELRTELTNLFASLCDNSLEDALDAARQERDRRAEGVN